MHTLVLTAPTGSHVITEGMDAAGLVTEAEGILRGFFLEMNVSA